MWKHKTKWLVRGGRKVRCYLCGKKILAKGDLFLFHGDTGYYSHQSCQAESTTISGNERRRAVKKIAVGAAVVGAIAAGAGKLIDISSQSKGTNSPAAQTILTSQGLIPPALTSDPANPVPGQMWYRSDAGVMAHFDAVQNRVVYSSEINDGNVHVTSKGIVNGLSVLPNDGTGWFGPDTTKGATAPGQYGGTYTETSGIAEALASYKNIFLLSGVFSVSTGITLPSTGNISVLGTTNTIINLVNLPDNDTFFNCPSNSTASYLFTNLIFDYGGSSNNDLVFNFNSAPTTANSIFENITTQNSSSSTAYFGILGGGVIYANNLTVLSAGGIVLNGVGRFTINNVFIQEVAASDNAFAILPGNSAASFYDVSNVYIDATGTTPIAASFVVALGGNSPTGVYAIPCNITNLTITNSSPTGHSALEIDSQSGSGVIFDGITIDGLQLYNTNGVSVNGTRALVINNFYINVAPGDGGISYFSNSIGGVLSNGIFFSSSGSSGAAISLLQNSGLQLTNISITGDWQFGIAVESGATKCMFDNIIFSGTFSISPFESNFLDGTSIANNIQGFGLSIAFSTNPPASGTAYQNTNPFALRLKIPVTYSPTSTAAATLATGTSSTSTVTTSTKVSYPAGITTGIIETYEMVVKAGQYFEIVVTNATIGTVEVQAA